MPTAPPWTGTAGLWMARSQGRKWETVGGKPWEGGLQQGPPPDGQKQEVKPEPIISHPSYISDVWGGELFRDPRRRVCGPRGVRALDRRRGRRQALIERINIRRGSGNFLKNNIAFHLSRKYIQTVAPVFCTTRGAEKNKQNGMQENWPLFEKIKPPPASWL